MRPGHTATVPTGPIPTDRDSLISIVVALAAIAAAVVVGVFLANANPSQGVAGESPAAPTLRPSPRLSPVLQPTGSVPAATAAPAATPVPTQAPPGTVAFGHGLSPSLEVVEPDDNFAPGEMFAHAISLPEPFGVAEISEQVVRVREGQDPQEVQPAEGNTLGVDPNSNRAGFVCCDSANLLGAWGPGLYEMRVFREGEVIAVGRFQLSEG
jgi:hypothetical protein